MLIKPGNTLGDTDAIIPQTPAEADELVRLIYRHHEKIQYLNGAASFALRCFQDALERGCYRNVALAVLASKRRREWPITNLLRWIRKDRTNDEIDEIVWEISSKFRCGGKWVMFDNIDSWLRAWKRVIRHLPPSPAPPTSFASLGSTQCQMFISVNGIDSLLYTTLMFLESRCVVDGEAATVDQWLQRLRSDLVDLMQPRCINEALSAISLSEPFIHNLTLEERSDVMQNVEHELLAIARPTIDRALATYEMSFLLEH